MIQLQRKMVQGRLIKKLALSATYTLRAVVGLLLLCLFTYSIFNDPIDFALRIVHLLTIVLITSPFFIFFHFLLAQLLRKTGLGQLVKKLVPTFISATVGSFLLFYLSYLVLNDPIGLVLLLVMSITLGVVITFFAYQGIKQSKDS